MEKGYVSLILHSHLPFTRHPDINNSIEELWLFEAIHECYLPLIEVFNRLKDDQIPYRITFSISPTLLSMLQDEYLNTRFIAYMQRLLQLGEIEIFRTDHQIEFNQLAKYYYDRLSSQLKTYTTPGFSLLGSLQQLEESGHLKLITTAATHGFLPLSLHHPEAVKAQLYTGINTFQKAFGHKPDGIWLPECAYYYNLDRYLTELGIRYFISENITVLNSLPGSINGTFTPVTTTSGVCIFPRDAEASKQVWSNIHGYPAHPSYREFYRDIGYDLPVSYLQQSGFCINQRHHTGYKYYRVTDKSDNKLPYDRSEALAKAMEDGRDYAKSRYEQISKLSAVMKVPPIITCPFDTELFGHWWYEGPEFLEAFIRESALYSDTYTLISPSDYLDENKTLQCVAAAPGSWGENSDFSLWLNKSNDWIVRDLYQCRESMVYQASRLDFALADHVDSLTVRALKQAARELMLAESSDWQFLISRNTATAYAIGRVTTHLEHCRQLLSSIDDHKIDEGFLSTLENKNNIFPDVDYLLYKRK